MGDNGAGHLGEESGRLNRRGWKMGEKKVCKIKSKGEIFWWEIGLRLGGR